MTYTNQAPLKEYVWAPEGPSEVMDCVAHFLDKCPESYENLWTKAEVLNLVELQILNPMFYMVNEIAVAMMLYSLQRYSPTVSSVKLELFCSVVSMWKVTSLMDVIEHKARLSGITMIEAVAQPTLAEYLVRKKGFSAPSVYVTKTIKYERVN